MTRALWKLFCGLKPVFIIGCARSGTTWLGRILQGHESIYATVESPLIFRCVTAMALDDSRKSLLMPPLLCAYRCHGLLAGSRLLVDKSHPNIWLAEELLAVFPGARFIGIQRSVWAAVASMCRHPGVRRWFDRWERYPLPNRFLGITEADRRRYPDLPLAAKCAMRWKSHTQRLQALRAALGQQLHWIQYENLVGHTMEELERLRAFLGLEKPFAAPAVDSDAVHRWRRQLSATDVAEILSVVPPADLRADDGKP